MWRVPAGMWLDATPPRCKGLGRVTEILGKLCGLPRLLLIEPPMNGAEYVSHTKNVMQRSQGQKYTLRRRGCMSRLINHLPPNFHFPRTRSKCHTSTHTKKQNKKHKQIKSNKSGPDTIAFPPIARHKSCLALTAPPHVR